MAKLCHQCFHTPLGICKRHNDPDEHNRKFQQALEAAALPLIRWTAEYVYRPNPLLELLRGK